MSKRISLLGSTGSIGTQCLQVCEAMEYEVTALTAGSNAELLEAQARRWKPQVAVIADAEQYRDLKTRLADTGIRVAAGPEAICEAAAHPDSDLVLNAIVGIAGLRPTLAALDAAKPLALANKETLVTGGELVIRTAREKGVPILPVDSEHSAMFQCLHSGRREELQSVILTASGGPFHGWKAEQLRNVTPVQALAHPNWEMGSKITIDSATLMNKGLELIEAMWLFDLAPEDIQVVVHRQSVVHSAVEFLDGSVIAQMGTPDMRCAIQYALTYPRRMPLDVKRLSLLEYGTLTFEAADTDTFRCLAVCIDAARAGGLAPCVANGANEEAVRLFLEGKLSFTGIGELVERAVEHTPKSGPLTLESVEEADGLAREYVLQQAGR